ncbi:MAG: hypothetical protein HC896_17395 [Bacteroidales bacterium]|nr:hypothetical protein [Bacteroidales bacterium]
MLSPHIYYYENVDPENNTGLLDVYDYVMGVGLQANYEWFNKTGSDWGSIYLSPGAGIFHYTLEQQLTGFHETTDQFGQHVIIESPYTSKRQANQIKPELLLGIQTHDGNLFFDFYVGSGFKYTWFDVPRDEVNLEIRNNLLDFGYSGFYPVGGVKVGWYF